MNLALLNESKMSLGGGWSWSANFIKGMGKLGYSFTDWRDAEVCIIPGATMVSKELFEQVEQSGKKILLRIDNIPRNSRNRNTGTSRLKKYAQEASAVVYQSSWAREYISPFVGKEGSVIMNSVDENIFSSDGSFREFGDREDVYLYSRYNRDETKMWEVAWYDFQMISRNNPDARLILVGRFSDEIREYNFDFYNGEKVDYLGVIETPQDMATVYRGVSKILIPYYNDACSNTLIESLMCGVDPISTVPSGGTPEILAAFDKSGPEYFKLNRMAVEYSNLIDEL